MRILIKNQQKHRRLNTARIKKAAQRILSILKQPTSELSILFVGDKKMQELNTIFRGVHKTTDVLAFPQVEFSVRSLKSEDEKLRRCEDKKTLTSQLPNFLSSKFQIASRITHHASLLLGDIVINISQAQRQAKKYKVSFYNEIYRLLIHGVLHLLGYDHEKSGYRTMRKKEQEIFNAVKKVF